VQGELHPRTQQARRVYTELVVRISISRISEIQSISQISHKVSNDVLTKYLSAFLSEEEDTCHMRRRIHVIWGSIFWIWRISPIISQSIYNVCPHAYVTCIIWHVSSSSYDMYPPPHMTCILLIWHVTSSSWWGVLIRKRAIYIWVKCLFKCASFSFFTCLFQCLVQYLFVLQERIRFVCGFFGLLNEVSCMTCILLLIWHVSSSSYVLAYWMSFFAIQERIQYINMFWPIECQWGVLYGMYPPPMPCILLLICHVLADWMPFLRYRSESDMRQRPERALLVSD